MVRLQPDAELAELLDAAGAVGGGDPELVRHAHGLIARVGTWCVRLDRTSVARVEAQIAAGAVLEAAGVAVISGRGDGGVELGGGWVASVWHWEDDLGLRAGSRGLGRVLESLRGVNGAGGLPSADPIPWCLERLSQMRHWAPGTLAGELDTLGRRVAELEGAFGAAGGGHFVHGDLHPGNLIATERGWVVCDLESAGSGPVGYDLAVCALRSDRYADEPRIDSVLAAAGLEGSALEGLSVLCEVYATSITVGAYWVALTEGSGLAEARKRNEWLEKRSGGSWRFL